MVTKFLIQAFVEGLLITTQVRHFYLFFDKCNNSVFYKAVMCPGYTGSPVTCDDGNGQEVLVGLQSFNWACNTPYTPAVYTSLRQLRQWIDYTLEKGK